MTQPANFVPPKSPPPATAATSQSAPAPAHGAVPPATPPPVAVADSGAAAKPAEPAKIDTSEARRATEQRAWERRKQAEREALTRERAELDRRSREFEATQRQLLERFAQPPEPPKPLPPEIETHIQRLARENEELKRRLDARDTADKQRAQQQTFDQALDSFVKMALDTKDSPLAAELAKKDPKRFKAAATRIVKEDQTLQDEEILGMLEDELSLYADLRRPSPPPEDTAAPSAPTTPAKPTPGTASPQDSTSPGATRATNLAAMRARDRQRTDEALRKVREARAARANQAKP